MQKLFNKILVPVDFTNHSKVTLERAGDIAKQYNCSLYLLYVSRVSLSSVSGNSSDIPATVFEQMEELRLLVREYTANTITIDYSILPGSWDEIIIDMVTTKGIDLVLTGQEKGKKYKPHLNAINPDKIAAKTNVPVLTIPAGQQLLDSYSIAIPVTNFLPVRKLMYGVYMASHYHTRIKLLGIITSETKDKVQYYMEKAYLLLRENCDVEIELKTIASQDVSTAVNEYTAHQSADLIIINPGNQDKQQGFFAKLFEDMMHRTLKPVVLTVAPFQ